ncbi:MAG: hypothetical protein ABII07_04660 [Patescibacteria group bacterium]|nr:hypothetical protein [Patescibacteria group bacterium]
MQNFTGAIIEESLSDKSVLDKVKIIKTKVDPVTERHQTPQVNQWTLHTVEIDSGNAEKIAELLSKSLEKAWYADYKNDEMVYIIFRDKIFKISRNNPSEFQEAKKYGVSLGIPEYQVNFSPEW